MEFTLRHPMELWNGGIMEYWVLKTEFILNLISFLLAVSKKDFILFRTHYSNLPIFHHSTSYAIGLAILL
jgi:hypothetical protein